MWVRGKLAKDDGTFNLLAEEVQGLRLHGMRDAGSGIREPPDADASRIPHPDSHESPYSFLKAFRRLAPESKDWG
jgi:hypothetical protein